jgi:hypothetical protein
MPLPSRPQPAVIAGRTVLSNTVAEAVFLEPSPRFALSAHPDSYTLGEVDGKPMYLPVIAKHILSPGVNGVGKDGDQSFCKSNIEGKGSIWINPDQCPAEMTPDHAPGYLRRYEGVSGPVHLEAWLTVVKAPGNRGHVAQGTKPGQELYNRWRLWLMESGVVPFPSEDWIERFEETKSESLRRRSSLASMPEPRIEAAEKAAEIAVKTRKARANVPEVSNG